jgi:hypothetical protein
MCPLICRIAIIIVLCAVMAHEAAAQTTSYLQLSPTVKAVLHSPDPSSKTLLTICKSGSMPDFNQCAGVR